MVVAPIAPRMARMDLRTTSRKAARAFSMRCQRSATWSASGKACAPASPYPAPRLRYSTRMVACHARNTLTVGVTIRQQLDDPVPLQITNDGAILMVAPKRPVIDPHDH